MFDPIIIAGLTCFGLGTPMGILLSVAWRKLSRRGKVRLLVVDSDSHDLREIWAKPDGRKVTVGKSTVLLEGDCSFNSDTWIVRAGTGQNLRAPRSAELEGSSLVYAVAAVSNPSSYHKEIRRHRWEDTLQAGREVERNDWVKLAIIFGFIAVLIILGGIGYLIIHLPHAAASAPAATTPAPHSFVAG